MQSNVKVKKPIITGKLVGKILTYAVLILYSLFLLFPFMSIFVTSFTSLEFLVRNMGFYIPWPEDWTGDNYVYVFTSWLQRVGDAEIPGILLGFLNTLWQVIPTLMVNLFVSGLAAFAYAKLNFPGKNLLYAIQIGIIVLPMSTMTIPTYVYYTVLNWHTTVLPLIIPGMFGGATTIFYLSQYLRGIPTDIVDAAQLDGLGTMGIYVRIILPLSVPAFVAQAILGFVGGYNGYLGPLLYLFGQSSLYPLQLSLSIFQSEIGKPYNTASQGVVCASVLVSMLPLIIFFIIFRKQFKEGITDGGVKG